MRWRGLWIGIAVFVLASIPGQSCGPYFVQMTFVNPDKPDDMGGFTGGKPWVLGRNWQIRSLALAYRMMQGTPITEPERKALIEARSREDDGEAWPDTPKDGPTLWLKARAALLGEPAPVPPAPGEQTVPGTSWQTFANCQNDAFLHAVRTLQQRQREHAAAHRELTEWVHGQDAVFTTCSRSGDLPATLPPGSPIWLVKDRDYQTAAAHLYHEQWRAAETSFASIAADPASPWRDLAAYMLGRTLLRESTLLVQDGKAFDPSLMQQAERQFQSVARANGPYAQSANSLLDLIGLRLHPGRTVARLGNAVAKPDRRLVQQLTDLRFSLVNSVGGSDGIIGLNKEEMVEARKSDLVDWIMTVENYDIRHATARWRQTHSEAWLVAALIPRNLADPKQPAPDPDLLQAATAVPETSPAWATLSYARLSLQGPTAWPETVRIRAALLDHSALPSAVNAFTGLALASAPSPEDFARLAPMEPVATRDYDSTWLPLEPRPTSHSEMDRKGAWMAGLPVNVLGVKRFNDDTARVLNERIPLATLATMVETAGWPKQLRFEAAMAVWTRAVLLGRDTEARRMTPTLIDGEPGWKTWLTAYDASLTDESRHVTGLLALMRFPSVRPYVQAGPGREEGFVGYSEYRDNWWCAEMGHDSQQTIAAQTLPFMTPAMLSEAEHERAALLKIGDAPAYFGREAQAWAKANSTDPRSPEVLAFAFRAMRNGCNQEASFLARRDIFRTLHARYPDSEWAKKFPNFTSDTQ